MKLFLSFESYMGLLSVAPQTPQILCNFGDEIAKEERHYKRTCS